ncbi:MAG: helix-turn-helix transcriptional regulator [Sinomonas sp.]|nr:helix-turn-helix transcriptional regulator [Sinomonas sp.]
MTRTTAWRFDVKLISTEAFRSYVKHRGMTMREIAFKAGVSPQLIGHLHSGHRTSCRPENARAIEKALDAPRGSLFLDKQSIVSRDVPARRAA